MIGVILMHEPRLSETFIAHELEALAQRGLPLRLYALSPVGIGGGGHPMDVRADVRGARFTLPVTAPPAARLPRAIRLARAQVRLALRSPRRYARLLMRKVIRRTWVRMGLALRGGVPMTWSHAREFLLAGWLAAEATAAGVTHLHAHYASGPATVALLVQELTGIPMSFTAHAKDAYVASRRRLRKKLLAARFIVTCSSAVRDYLSRLAPERAGDIQVIHHGLSPAVLPATNGRSRTSTRQQGPVRRHNDGDAWPLVLAAGRLVEKKGFSDLVRALALLRDRGVPFRAEIVGEGRLHEQLRDLAAQLGLDGALRLPGALRHDLLADRYRDASCFVMPSRVVAGGNRDGIPNVLLEAMASGAPVVATAVGGIPEVVTDGMTGLLAREGDVEGLASRIAGTLSNPARASERASRAREAVLARFDLERNVGRLIDAFRAAGAIAPPRTRSLRVGYVLKRYPRLSETFILEEILEQERQGTEVHIVSLKKPDEGRFHADLARVRARVTYLPGYIVPSLGRIVRANARWFGHHPGRYLAALGLALRGGDRHPITAFLKASVAADLIVERKLDLLHAHFATGATFMAMLASRLTGVPYGFTAHARDLFGQHIDRRALRRKVERSAYVVVVSEATRDYLQSVAGERLACKVRRIHNGVHPGLLRRPAPRMSGGTPLILAVGRLVEKKGLTHLLQAAARLKARGLRFRLAIAGAGPLRRSLEDEASELGIEVNFLGALPHGAVLRAMRGARAVVLPAVVGADGDRDVLPTVLLEAQALARPVVSTRLTGIPEIVADGESGFLVSAADSEELADPLATALEKLLLDRGLAATLGTAGRRRVAERFDLSRNVAVLAGCMRTAASRTTGGARGASREARSPAAGANTTGGGAIERETAAVPASARPAGKTRGEVAA